MAISAADLMVTFKADTKDAESGIQRVNKGITGFAKSAAAMGAGVLGAQVFSNFIRDGKQAAQVGLDFGRGMANVNSILQASDSQIAQYSDDVLQIALRTAQAPGVLAAGLYQVVSSGFSNITDAETILEIAANGATAGLTSTDVSARALTGTLNAYGDSVQNAQRYSDIMFQTVNDGVLSYDQFANNLGKTTSLAANLNVPFEQLGASYAQLTLNNVDAAAAETDLSALLRSAINPTTALTTAVRAHGYASAEALIKSEGLPGYLKFLNETAGGSSTALGDLTGNIEAGTAAMILSKNGVKDYNKELDKMNHASDGVGATQKALEKQMKSASFQIQKAKVALQVLAIQGFGIFAPLVARGASALTGFLTKGVIPFTKMIGAALKGGFAFDKMLTALPQPLRRAAHAVGVMAESIGDMIRGGISKGELTQFFHGFQAFSEELSQGVHFVANIIVDAAVTLGSLLIDGVKAAPGVIFNWVRGKLFGQNTGQSQDPASPMSNMKGAPIDVGFIDVAVRLGELIVNGITGGIGNLWDWVRGQILGNPTPGAQASGALRSAFGLPGGTTPPLDAGVIDVAVALGKVILNGATGVIGDLWGWVKSKIMGGGPVGDATGGPAAVNVNTIDFGTVAITAAAKLGGELQKVAADFKGWVTGQLHVAKDQVIQIGTITLQGNVKIESAGGDDKAAQTWVDRFVANVKRYGGPVRDAGIWVSTQLASGAGYAAGAAIGGFVDAAGAIVLGLVAAIKDPSQIAKIGVGINDALRLAFNATAWSFGPITGVATAFYSALAAGFSAVTPDLSFITDKLFGGISAGASQDPASPMYGGGATAGLFANLGTTLQLGLSAAIQSFTPDVGDIGTKITTALGTAWVDALAAFTTAFNPDFGFISDDITTALNAAKDAFTAPDFGSIGTAIQAAIDAIPKPTIPSWISDPIGWISGQVSGGGKGIGNNTGEGGGGGGKGFRQLNFDIPPNVDGIPTSGGTQQTLPAMVLPAADTSAFTASLASASAAAQAFAAATYQAKLTGDNGQFAQAYTAAFGWGTVFASQTFQSTLSGDNGPMATAYTNAFGWGNTFAAQDFQATLSADDGPAAAAYTEAFGWGSIWASQVFTASFSVDVSGLYAAQAVAYQVAANIAAIMPHSPAKRGPLSKPIRFTFIGDAARRDLAGIGNEIEGYLGTNRHRVGARGERSRGGNHITVNALKSAELIRLIKDAETGGSFARGLGRELGLSGGF